MSRYEKCGKDIDRIVARIWDDHHARRVGLSSEDIEIGCLWYWAGKNEHGDVIGPPLKLHGYPAQAIVKVISYKQRVQGLPDAEIVIDGDNWELLSEAERDALLDHELEHIDVKRKDGEIAEDDLGRPKLRLRLHDVEVGWFIAIAERHGSASAEMKQAAQIADKYGQLLFPWAVVSNPERLASFLAGKTRKTDGAASFETITIERDGRQVSLSGEDFRKLASLVPAGEVPARLMEVRDAMRKLHGNDYAVQILPFVNSIRERMAAAPDKTQVLSATLTLVQQIEKDSKRQISGGVLGMFLAAAAELITQSPFAPPAEPPKATAKPERADPGPTDQTKMAITRDGKAVPLDPDERLAAGAKRFHEMMNGPTDQWRGLYLDDMGITEDAFRSAYYPTLLKHGGGTLARDVLKLPGMAEGLWIGVTTLAGEDADYRLLPLHAEGWVPPADGGIHCGKLVTFEGKVHVVGCDHEAIPVKLRRPAPPPAASATEPAEDEKPPAAAIRDKKPARRKGKAA